MDKRVIKVGSEDVTLDPDNMAFSEATLSNYLEKEGGWYDYFGRKLADCEWAMQRLEHEFEVVYSERFKEHKDLGCSDKLAEANAKADVDVEAAKKLALEMKHKVRLLQQHLRAWDKNHENAQSRGHFLRKEMDKLNKDIYLGRDNYMSRLDDIIKESTYEAPGEPNANESS